MSRRRSNTRPTKTLIDLFAGAGGLTLGFTQAGFEPILAVEIDPWAARTYKANFGAHVLDHPIETVDQFPAAHLVIGGPPCQGFSPLGRDRDDASRTTLNDLWRQYVRAVEQVRPAIFLIENVPQFLQSAQYQAFLRYCKRKLPEYEIAHTVLNAVDYGAPQRRRRGFVMGSRVGSPSWPTSTHTPGGLTGPSHRTVRDAISDLPLKPTNDNLHWGRNPRPESIERYRAVPEGGNRFDLARNRPDLLPECWRRKKSGTTDVFGRLWWDRPAFTIRTEFYKPEKGRYLHPKAHRPLTHREAARLQTFPDSFVFEGSKVEVARQIGNAVPPRLARTIAEHIRDELLGGTARSERS
ncbi:MAG TPA: DNA cytosine methyltransferase [Actinomycetota bacterium]|nr:DNA cytosine methyltransferase [Actinomycetota bacterium]